MPVSARARGVPRLLVAGTTALIATLLSALVALANVPLVQVSSDPFTNSSSMHATQVEPDTFSYGNTIVATFQSGRFYDGGSSDIGWSTSTDGGTTWVHGFLPGTTVYATPPGPYARISDPAVAYDPAHGVWMIVSLPLPGAGVGSEVYISRSTNGGLTWQNPVSAYNPGGGLDKTWIACDGWPSSPYYGHCYAEWDDNYAGNVLNMVTSTDGGLTWGPVGIPGGSPSGLGGQPVALPNGTVVVPYSANYGGINSFRSTDGGQTWGGAITVSGTTYHSVTGMRAYPMPAAEVDPGGRVYVVWHDCRFRSGCSANDIVMSSSVDGLTWTPVVRIPIDAVTSGVDHFLPGIAVGTMRADPVSRLALTYYYFPTANCSVATCQLMVGYVSSWDGGRTWSAPTQLAGPMTITWLPQTNQGYMVGDYISTSFAADGTAHPVFAVAHAPSGSTYDEAMYAPATGLPLGPTGQSVIAGRDKPLVYVAPNPLQLLRGALPTAH